MNRRKKMKIITELIDNMDSEIDLAKIYAQNFLMYKADKNIEWAEYFRNMARESISHADRIHELAIITIDKLGRDYTPPEEMIRVWNKAHGRYIDIINWITDMIK